MDIIKYSELIEDGQMGITDVECDALGLCTFVGVDRNTAIIVQLKDDNSFVSLPELEFNLRKFTRSFEDETHVRYISVATLMGINNENVSPGYFNFKKGPLADYKVVLTISKVPEGKEEVENGLRKSDEGSEQ